VQTGSLFLGRRSCVGKRKVLIDGPVIVETGLEIRKGIARQLHIPFAINEKLALEVPRWRERFALRLGLGEDPVKDGARILSRHGLLFKEHQVGRPILVSVCLDFLWVLIFLISKVGGWERQNLKLRIRFSEFFKESEF